VRCLAASVGEPATKRTAARARMRISPRPAGEHDTCSLGIGRDTATGRVRVDRACAWRLETSLGYSYGLAALAIRRTRIGCIVGLVQKARQDRNISTPGSSSSSTKRASRSGGMMHGLCLLQEVGQANLIRFTCCQHWLVASSHTQRNRAAGILHPPCARPHICRATIGSRSPPTPRRML